MVNFDREYRDDLIAHTRETKSLFSNPRKREREIRIVRAFLRLFNIGFGEDELVAIPQEPIDVRAAGADFQVTEILDDNRRRQEEINERLERYQDAETIQDTIDAVVPGVPTSVTPRHVGTEELIERLSKALHAKLTRYGPDTCAQLDILAYVNLKSAVLPEHVESQVFEITETASWRSVSVLSNNSGLVIGAASSAPGFLREAFDRTARIWPQAYGLWEP